MDSWEALRDERNHIEGLLNQRFNFFIIVVGFGVASIPYVQNLAQFRLVLVTVFILVFAFTLLIGRAERRLRINIEMLAACPDDPTEKIRKRADQGFGPFKVGWLRLMVLIPGFVTSGLFVTLWFTQDIYQAFRLNDHHEVVIYQSEFYSWLTSPEGIVQSFSLILGLAGIVLALFGGLKLFTRISLLREIIPVDTKSVRGPQLQEVPSNRELSDAVKHLSKVHEDLYKDLLQKISDEIKHSSKVNDDSYKEAKKKYFPYIIWGSIMTALSLILAYISSFSQVTFLH